MSEKPRNRASVQRLIGNLQEYLGSEPFHLQTVLVKDGFPSLLGLAAGLWEKVRTVQVAAVPEAPPTSTSRGIDLFEFSQARFHVAFDVAAVGGETASITVWHRSHSYGDTSTVGHWTRGQVYVGVDNLEEVLDPSHWHTEIYLQVTAVAAGACTELTLFVQGVEGMNAGADVNVVVPPITVAISAYSAPPSSVLAVGTDDGTVSGAPTVQTVTTDGTAVQQADATKLKMTEASAASILARANLLAEQATLATRASEATVATLATQATAASIKTAVELIDDAVFSQGDASGKFLAGGAEIQDPTTLPADGIAGKVRRILADLKGILFTRAMLGVAGAAPTAVAGVSANLPETKTTTYDAGMVGSFAPLVDGVTVTTVAGAAAAVTVIGRAITQTVVLGASTKAHLDAAWAACSAAVALCTFSCTAGTVAAGYVGETLSLWTARTTQVSESLMKMSDGTVAPIEGDALTGAQKVFQRGMNMAVDAQQTMAVVAAPKGVNGPADLLVSAAQADAGGAGTAYDTMTLEFANYDTLTVDGYWACAGAETYQIDILQRLDAADAWKNVNALFLPAGVLGVPSVNGNFSVGTSVRVQWNKVLVRRTKVGNTACPVAFRYMVGR